MARRRIACDVFVVGSGVAGISAAVRAAREGAHTVLIEKHGHPGGTAVTGMHRFICGLYGNGEDAPDTTLNGGIAVEVCAGLKARAPEKEVQRMGKVHVLPFSTSDLVSTLRSLSGAEGRLEILYGTRAVSVRVEEDAIASIAARDAAGEVDIFASAVIDCSGDGIIIQMSGARHQVTPPGEQQLAGYSFRIKGLQEADELLAVRVPYLLRKAVDDKELPPYLRFTTYAPGDDPDEGYCRLNIPPAGDDRNEQARKDALWVHGYLSRMLSAFKGSRIVEMSPEVAYREGVRARGEYTLTADDVLQARKFSDGAVKNAWPIELWDQEKGPSYRYLDPGDYYEIPLRCLKPQGISNFWCAGRCISASHDALGSTRVMGTCIALGEEAGREAARIA
jgi:2-polyprenyl-6-methoxyphenol hydroxylase-like FAD-dependent oxidoreductase